MATIEERRAKAAGKRIRKGKKPFTDSRPPPPKAKLPKKGVVKVPEGQVQDFRSVEHYRQWKRDEEAAGRGLGQLNFDDEARAESNMRRASKMIGKTMPKPKKKRMPSGYV